MKKLITILFLFVLITANAQQGGTTFPTLDAMRSYSGSLSNCGVSQLDSTGVFCRIKSTATVDNAIYFSCALSGYRWFKIAGLGNGLVDTSNFVNLSSPQDVLSTAPKTWEALQTFNNSALVVGSLILYDNANRNNELIGSLAGSILGTSYRDNVAFGFSALRFARGNGNIGIGTASLVNANGNNNTSVGFQSLNITDSSDNSAFGSTAAIANYGKQNTSIGSRSGNFTTIATATVNNTEITTSSASYTGTGTATFISANSLSIGGKYNIQLSFNGTPPEPYNSSGVTALYADIVVNSSNTITLQNASNFTTQGTSTSTITLFNKQNNSIAIGYNAMTTASNQIVMGNSSSTVFKANNFVVDLTSIPTTGYVLAWNGTAAVWAAQSGGGGGGTITNPITFNNSNSGAASGVTANGSAPVTVSANTIGAQPLIDYSYHTLTYSGTTNVNYNTAQKYVLTLTGNTTLSYSNFISGGTVIIDVFQDATGGRTLNVPSGTVSPTGAATGLQISLSTAAGAMDKLSITKNNITGKYEIELAKAYQ